MQRPQERPKSKDNLLFTPGPLTTSQRVKQAMLRDVGSRDSACIACVQAIRDKLLAIGGVSAEAYTAVPMQGSGTFAVEAVIASTIPPHGKLLVIVNGAYGKRMVQMAHLLRIDTTALTYAENQKPDLAAIQSLREDDASISDVIGTIGRIFAADVRALLGAIRETLAAMGVTLRHQPHSCA